MARKLILVDGKNVLAKLALPPPRDGGVQVVLGEKELDSLVELYGLAGNRRRLEMMLRLGRTESSTFTDLLKVGINPKLVRDCLGPLVEMGLVLHKEGGDYRLSRRGEVLVPALTSWLANLSKVGEAD